MTERYLVLDTMTDQILAKDMIETVANKMAELYNHPFNQYPALDRRYVVRPMQPEDFNV